MIKECRCTECGDVFKRDISPLSKNVFCSLSCSSTYNSTKKSNLEKINNLRRLPSYREDDTETLKECTICSELKNLQSFYWSTKRPETPKQPSSYCKPCHNKETYQRYVENKLKAIEYLGGECWVCQGVYESEVFDFHHIEPSEKDFNLSKHRGKKFENLKPELDKCALVCANCHRLLHAKKEILRPRNSVWTEYSVSTRNVRGSNPLGGTK